MYTFFRFDVFNPRNTVIIGGFMDFESVNKLYAKVNCTIPLKTFPLLGIQLRTVTDP